MAACPSSCTQQLAECKQTCAGGGQGRRDCREACAERTTCTAQGARIRTLAYVVTECTMDPQGLTSLQQTFFLRRGNCDPVPVMVVGPSTPAPDPDQLCLQFGESRQSYSFLRTGVFQHMTLLPDGSGALFNVTKQFSVTPAVTPEPPEEGIFFVRADGSGLRKLGPASRVQAAAALAASVLTTMPCWGSPGRAPSAATGPARNGRERAAPAGVAGSSR